MGSIRQAWISPPHFAHTCQYAHSIYYNNYLLLCISLKTSLKNAGKLAFPSPKNLKISQGSTPPNPLHISRTNPASAPEAH